jgi:hypothetical protein
VNELQLRELESVLKLVTKYQLDSLELPDGTKISKKIHLGPKLPTRKDLDRPIRIGDKVLSDEDVMFAATAAPKMSLEDFDRLAANPPKDK